MKNKYNVFALLAAGLLLAMEPALASELRQANGKIWTIYAFGNADAMASALESVHNFVVSDTFQNLISLIAVVGVLVTGLTGSFNQATAKKFGGYVVMVALVVYSVLGFNRSGGLTVQVSIEDTVDLSVAKLVTVPAVVGIPASVISMIGQGVSEQIESSFMIDDAFRISQGAPFNLAAAFVNDASKIRITDSNLSASLAYYVQDCFSVGAASGAISPAALMSTTNFIEGLRYDNQAIMVNTMLVEPKGTHSLVNCSEAHAKIVEAINSNGTDAAAFMQNSSAWHRTPAFSILNSAAAAVMQWSGNNGTADGGAFVKQAAVLGAFKAVQPMVAQATGNSDALTALSLAQATETRVNGWLVGAEVFNRMMGYIYSVLQVFVYALTPFILCALLIPGLGFALFKNFGQLLLWLAITMPMLSIVNFVVLTMQQSELNSMLSVATPTGVETGFRLSTLGYITEKTSNMRAAGLFIGTLVPALAWSLVKGSMDFSRAIAGATGEQVAAQAATTMTTGNYSLNSAGMDSFTANKHSIGQTGDWGRGNLSTNGVGNQKFDGGATEYTAGSNSYGMALQGTTGTTSGMTGTNTTASSNSAAESLGAAKVMQAAISSGLIKTAADLQALASSVGLGVGASVGLPSGSSPMGPNGMPTVPGTSTVPAGGAQGTTGQNAPVETASRPMIVRGAQAGLRMAGAALKGANPRIQGNLNGTSTDQKTYGVSGTSGTTGSETTSGNWALNAIAQLINTHSIANSQGTQNGLTQTYRGVATMSDRMDAVRASRNPEGSGFVKKESGGGQTADMSFYEKTFYGTSSKMGQQVADAQKDPNSVEGAVAKTEQGLTSKAADYDKKLEEQRKAAADAKKKADRGAKAAMGPGNKAVSNAQKPDSPVNSGATKALVGAAEKVAPDTVAAIRSGADATFKALNAAGDEVAAVPVNAQKHFSSMGQRMGDIYRHNAQYR